MVTVVGVGCDSPPGPDDPSVSHANIKEVTVEPDSISFEEAEMVRDTSVNITIGATITNVEPSAQPSYVIRKSDERAAISSGSLSATDSNDTYEASVTLNLTTATFATFHVYIYADAPNPDGSWVQAPIRVTGFPGSPPIIHDVANPDTVVKPSGDTVKNVAFRAEVSDPDGQDNIAQVAFNLVRSGDTLDTIDLFDDGSDESGDSVAGDSVYTQVLSVNSDNESATYDIHYFARDKSGLFSDTVRTTFTITD